mgnify:CR=1 FL=1
MTDLWSFLLQTLTASGAAALLLAVKALFRDKLSPRWQFGVWGVLALVLLLPAGGGGRYALFNWPLWVESAKTALTGDYSLTRVLAPIPLPLGLGRPASPADLLYLLYLAGAAALLLQYGQEPEESCREIAPILAKNLTKSQIMRTIELLQKYRGECTYNVGTGQVLGAIAVELEDIL